jgi:hypothetical protein
VIDRGGAGLGGVQIGPHVTNAQRTLLEKVRAVLFDVRSDDAPTRRAAPGKWQALAAKVDTTLHEAVRFGLAAQSAARVRDLVDLVTRGLCQDAQDSRADQRR